MSLFFKPIGDAESGVPNSSDLYAHYDATELTYSDGTEATTWSAEVGPDLSSIGSPTFRTDVRNGNPVVEYDGSADGHNATFGSSHSQPNHVFVVFKALSYTDDYHFLLGTARDPDFQDFAIGGSNDQWSVNAGTEITGGTSDTSWHVVSILYDGANSELRLDGSQVFSGDAGANAHTDIALAYLADSDRFFTNCQIGEVLSYESDQSSSVSDIEGHLQDKWMGTADGSTMTVVSGSAGRTMFTQSPYAQYISSEDTTFMFYRGPDADPYAITYDHGAGSFSSAVQIGTNPLSHSDGHGPPTVVIDGSGFIHVFYGTHNSDLLYAVSDNAYDISSWTNNTLDSLPYASYPSPDTLNGNIYVSVRTGGPSGSAHGDTYPAHEFASIYESTDGGSTWSDLGPVLDFTDHPDSTADAYLVDMDTHDGYLHCTWLIAHGASHNDQLDDIYHARYDPPNDQWLDMAGNTFASPLTYSDMDSGVLRAMSQAEMNLLGHAFDGSNVYITGQDRNNEVQRFTHWDGSAWSAEAIDGGADWGHGSIRVNGSGNPEVFLGEDSSSARWMKYEKSGGSWTSTVINDIDTFYGSKPVRDAPDDKIVALGETGSDDETVFNKDILAYFG